MQRPCQKYKTKPASVLPLLQSLEIAGLFLNNFPPLHFLLEVLAVIQAEISVP